MYVAVYILRNASYKILNSAYEGMLMMIYRNTGRKVSLVNSYGSWKSMVGKRLIHNIHNKLQDKTSDRNASIEC
jgi:hypothetical protein